MKFDLKFEICLCRGQGYDLNIIDIQILLLKILSLIFISPARLISSLWPQRRFQLEITFVLLLNVILCPFSFSLYLVSIYCVLLLLQMFLSYHCKNKEGEDNSVS